MYFIQHCFICRPSDSTMSEDTGIERRTVATSGSAVRRTSHSVTSHPLLGYISSTTRLHIIYNSATSHPQLGYISANIVTTQKFWKKINGFLCTRDEPCCGNICRRLATPTPSSMWGATGSALSLVSNRYGCCPGLRIVGHDAGCSWNRIRQNRMYR